MRTHPFCNETKIRTCLHKKYMWIFEHNFVADKAKIRRRAVARQVFFTQYAAKFAEKTRGYTCEDRFSFVNAVFLLLHSISAFLQTFPNENQSVTLLLGIVNHLRSRFYREWCSGMIPDSVYMIAADSGGTAGLY